MAKQLPRGLRNHNPLNLRRDSSEWQGRAEKQTDPAFWQFKSNEYGYRAAFKNLRTAQDKYKCRTITDFISRWAPKTENNTRAYIDRVSRDSGIGKLVNVYWSNKEDMVKIVCAMSAVENGVPAVKAEVEEGYRLAFGF